MDATQARTSDGVLLRGEMLRADPLTWLVYVHDDGGDIDDWRPLLAELEPSGWSALALDLRGHGGSEGEPDAASYPLDVDVAVAQARSFGAGHVAIVAAGVGAVAALEGVERALAEPRAPLADSLVLLSPGPLAGVDLSRMRGEGLAKLVMSGTGAPQADDARSIVAVSIGWTVRVSFPGPGPGTGLLSPPSLEHVADKIGTFVREQAALGGPGLARLGGRGA